MVGAEAQLQTEGTADLAELHGRVAQGDVPAPAEREVLAGSHREVLGLLTGIEHDDPAVRALDQRVDSLLPRDAGVQLTRRLEDGLPRQAEASGAEVGGGRVRGEALVRAEMDEPLILQVVAGVRVVGVVPGLGSREGAEHAEERDRAPVVWSPFLLP